MGQTILFVEDYEDTQNFMKILIESYGYQVIEANDGIEAINRFKFYHPDLILMDISLLLVDGLPRCRYKTYFELLMPIESAQYLKKSEIFY